MKLIERNSTKESLTVINDLMNRHRPGLKEGNKGRLKKMFLYLLRYFDEYSKTRFEATMLDGLTKASDVFSNRFKHLAGGTKAGT